jgi:branched-chain amino acid transport system substrate-binding protein
VEELLATVGGGAFVLVAATDHDSRLAARELQGELAERNRGAAFRVEVQAGASDFETLRERLGSVASEALLLVAGPEDAARLVRAVCAWGFAGPIFGTPQVGRRRFERAAGAAAKGVRYPRLFDPNGPEVEAFVRRFRERTGAEPDWAAAHTYDAVRVLLEAIRRAGLDRAGIRDALAELGPWSGVTGTLEWDPTGQNRRPVEVIGTVGAP